MGSSKENEKLMKFVISPDKPVYDTSGGVTMTYDYYKLTIQTGYTWFLKEAYSLNILSSIIDLPCSLRARFRSFSAWADSYEGDRLRREVSFLDSGLDRSSSGGNLSLSSLWYSKQVIYAFENRHQREN